MEVVSSFPYLGVDFRSDGKWSSMCKRRCAQATARLHARSLTGLSRDRFSVPVGVLLWGSLIRPVVEYAAEIVSPNAADRDALQRLQNAAARAILHVSKATPIDVLHGELGWIPFADRCAALLLRFWHRLVHMAGDRMVRRVVMRRFARWCSTAAADRPQHCWMSEMHAALVRFGLEQWWPTTSWAAMPPYAEWSEVVDAAVLDRAQAEWRARLPGKSSLDIYCALKPDLVMEPYLSCDVSLRDASSLRSRLRSGAHDLDVSADRRRLQGDLRPREQRVCRVCRSGAAEDVAHFLLDCGPLQPRRSVLLEALEVARRDSPDLLPAIVPRDDFVLLALGKQPESASSPALRTAALDLDRRLMTAVHSMFSLRRRLLASHG